MIVDTISLILVIIGAINWGTIGFFGIDVVSTIFGTMSVMTRIIFSLVGIAGLWSITLLFRNKESNE